MSASGIESPNADENKAEIEVLNLDVGANRAVIDALNLDVGENRELIELLSDLVEAKYVDVGANRLVIGPPNPDTGENKAEIDAQKVGLRPQKTNLTEAITGVIKRAMFFFDVTNALSLNVNAHAPKAEPLNPIGSW